jgi:hypothetical protein
VRCLLVAAIVAFSSPAWAQFFEALPGSETPATAVEAPLAVAPPPPVAEAKVIITPVPMPTSVIEILKPAGRSPKLRTVARKVNPAKKKAIPNILLTRTERHQLALLAAKSAPGSLLLSHLLEDENGESVYDVLALHSFYSRPRLASEEEHEAGAPEADDLSDTIKLRLLLARLKAVEAHALAQVADPGDDLSAAIRERLAQARHKAVEAHRNKFS